ncbi:MAG: acylphosphatase [Nitrospirae bacterium]|nr:acylphosphatase [Nitrospirota bacterium]
MEKGRVHVFIRGYVQGVFFRASTKDIADGMGLTGWVRNLPDGSVEVMFEGPKDVLDRAVKWCHKGPPGASVTKVEEKWLEYTGEFKHFDIRYGYG